MTRPRVAFAFAALTLGACSGSSADVAACEQAIAMLTSLAGASEDEVRETVTDSAACQGLSEEQTEGIFGRVMKDVMFGTDDPTTDLPSVTAVPTPDTQELEAELDRLDAELNDLLARLDDPNLTDAEADEIQQEVDRISAELDAVLEQIP
jgi:hypothetical protein